MSSLWRNTGKQPGKVVGAWLFAAALSLPGSTFARQIDTNSPTQHLLRSVDWFAALVAPPSNQPPRTFTGVLKLTRGEGLPKSIANLQLEFAYQPPDHFRVAVSSDAHKFVACVAGKEMWVSAPAEKLAVASSGDEAPAMALPFSVAQLRLLPLVFDVEELPGESVGNTRCRVLQLTPRPDLVDVLKIPPTPLQVWLRESDALSVRWTYRDGKRIDLQLDLVDPRLESPWPAERWQLKLEAGNRVVTAAACLDAYDPTAPLNVVVSENIDSNDTAASGYTITRFVFDGYKGERIPALISLPTNPATNRLPAIIFLHGIGQDKNFLKVITAPFNQAGFAVASFDQYTRGERKLTAKAPLTDLAAFVERPGKTINETRRLLDYLRARADMDPRRIYLVGASYGAMMGSTVLAKDKRLRAGVLVYGGGDWNKLLDSAANHLGVAAALGLIDGSKLNPEKPPLPKLTTAQERQVEWVLGLLKPLAKSFLGPVDPIRYADRISPTPVYFQNGTHDVLVPAAAAEALQTAAREPKKITWYESDHVGIDREQTKQVLADGLNWLLEQDKSLR